MAMQLDPKRYDVAIKQIQKDLSEKEVIIKTQTRVITETQKNLGDFETLVADEIRGIVGEFEIVKSDLGTFQTVVTENLEAQNIKVGTIEGELGDFKTLVADEIFAINGTFNSLDAKYATLDLANVKNGSITQAMIGDAVVGTTQIANGSITDAKIVELTANKITAGTLSVERLEIRGNENSLVYALNNITGALQAQNVDTLNGEVLTPRTITADKIVAGAITANEIASNAITANKILAGSIITEKIAANAITTNEIAANAITTDKIAARAIKAEKIDVENLFAEDIVATGSISGLTFLSDGEPDYADIPTEIAMFLSTFNLKATGGVLKITSGTKGSTDYLESITTALGARYRAHLYEGSYRGIDEAYLDTNSFGIRYRARKKDHSEFETLFNMDVYGVYWEGSKLVSQKDLNDLTIAKALQDGNGNVITDTYLPKAGGTILGNLEVLGNVTFSKPLPVSQGGTGAKTIEEAFVTTTVGITDISVKAQSYIEDDGVIITKEGYYPLALAGFWTDGKNDPRISFSDVYLSGQVTGSAIVNYSISNWSSNYDFEGTIFFKVVWVKAS